MPVVVFTTLWLAASAPESPVSEDRGQPPAPAAGARPDARERPKTGQPPAPAPKKSSDNDEPGCEE